MRPARLILIAAAVLAAPAPAAAAETRSLPADHVDGGVASFRVAGVDAASVRRAVLRVGRRSRRVPLHVARAGARRGIMRLGMTKGMRTRLAAAGRVPRPRLVLVVATAGALLHAPGAGPAGDRITQWRAPGSPPLTDAQAAERVRSAPEKRPGNAAANRYYPSQAELAAFHGARYRSGPNAGSLGDDVIPQQRHVTGRFRGTTDEILQWAAHKWGIPEDILRAVAVQESGWTQAARGDRERVRSALRYPRQARISGDEVYESMGLMQIKWRPDGSLHPGTEPLRWKSTAFNADFYGAVVRFYYDGTARSWFSSRSPYRRGQEWESVGAWFQPTPWRNALQLGYIVSVKARLADRAWTSARF